jgi:carboxyl-terminal processing protease
LSEHKALANQPGPYFDLDEDTRMGGRLINPAQRLLPLAALMVSLALAGCGSTAAPDASSAMRDETRDMFVTGMNDIDAVYIDRVNLGDVALEGLKRLDAFDPAVTLRHNSTEVELDVEDQPPVRFDAPSAYDATDWGELAARYVETAKLASPKLALTPPEQIYETVFDGMVSKLDGFSRYSSAADADENRASRDGFGGIGVRVAVADGKVRIISVMNYTPAQRAGLQPEDIVLAIDGQDMAGLDQRQVVEKLRGPVDSRVELKLLRRDAAAPVTMLLSRAHVVPETVVYHPEGNVAYFHIYGFNSDTAESLEREIAHAKSEIGAGNISGYVLDLRSNPGGLLDEAVAVSDLFMQKGRIVSTHGRHPDSHQYFEATAGDMADGRPVVVLVNGNSASASEIVAAALQDSGRAVVVGSNSYGKGTVQTVLRLPNSGELTLTWARFHAPSGYTLNKLGVLPSVCTNGHSPSELVAELEHNQLRPVPVAERNALKPTDTAEMDKLRKTCPQVKSEPATDVEMALDLIHKPTLYSRAVALGESPSPADAAEAAIVTQSQQP